MITIFAPDGIAEVRAKADLATLIISAVVADPAGPLADGDIVVVTSKIVSKAESRTAPVAARDQLITAETARTVARRQQTRIVRTRSGTTLAAAGVDESNVDADSVLLLPADPDASAARLRADLSSRTGRRLGVVVSDTAGRPWRVGQTDFALGAAGVQVLRHYEGQSDPYGNQLRVTAMATADELAAAAELAKDKLGRRPVAVIRGLAAVLTDHPDEGAAGLVREPSGDMFGYGSREAVIAAICTVTGQRHAYERLVALDGEELAEAVVAVAGRDGAEATLLRELVRAAAYPASNRQAG